MLGKGNMSDVGNLTLRLMEKELIEGDNTPDGDALLKLAESLVTTPVIQKFSTRLDYNPMTADSGYICIKVRGEHNYNDRWELEFDISDQGATATRIGGVFILEHPDMEFPVEVSPFKVNTRSVNAYSMM